MISSVWYSTTGNLRETEMMNIKVDMRCKYIYEQQFEYSNQYNQYTNIYYFQNEARLMKSKRFKVAIKSFNNELTMELL